MNNNGFNDLIKAGSILAGIAGFVILWESIKALEKDNQTEIVTLLKRIDKKLK